jgi:uncharacterized protein
VSIPIFKYHPDPIVTGSVVSSDAKCICCDQQRGFIYVGPVYAVDELSECICPWRIADGSAHIKFGAELTDAAGVGGYPRIQKLPQLVIEEVAYRTPGFSGWQQERWLACCDDAAAFVGHAGRVELQKQFAGAVESIRMDSEMKEGHWQHYLSALNKNGDPTAYIFRCLHCGKHLGYSDRT